MAITENMSGFDYPVSLFSFHEKRNSSALFPVEKLAGDREVARLQTVTIMLEAMTLAEVLAAVWTVLHC